MFSEQFKLCYLLIIFCAVVSATMPSDKNKAAVPVAGADLGQPGRSSTLLNINQLAVWIHSNGLSARGPDGGAGLFFPRGSNPLTAVVFQDQLMWGGKVRDGQEPVIRVGGGQYAVGHVPGKILSPGVPESRTAPDVNRVWRIRRDFTTADLTLDAAEVNSILPRAVLQAQVHEVRDAYRDDWLNWPAEHGAPFYDADGDGHYKPAFLEDGTPKLSPKKGEPFNPEVHADEPGFAGGDQVVWLVVNDLDEGSLKNFSGSPPIGMEMQVTLWGYARDGALNHTIFRRHRLIYKGTQFTPSSSTIDSFYIAQWVDPDVGSAGNDLVGCDTHLDLGFGYNESNFDAVFRFSNLPPPSVGHELLAGPLVPESGATANYSLHQREGYENLKMTSFMRFRPCYCDFGTYDITLELFNIFRGYLSRPLYPLTPIIDPTTGGVTTFAFSGDPVSGIGWIDQQSTDKRFLLSSGPLTMALGDTQEVTIAVVAGLGSDRLSSFAAMRLNAATTKQLFENFLSLPQRPPTVKVTEFDGQILLNWGSDPDQLARTEARSRELQFEGYNVYQLPGAGAALSEGIKLATFDIKNDIAAIVQPVFDAASGMVLNRLAQAGSNSGISRTFLATRDSLNREPLYSGQTYHFAVTAYLVNPDRSRLVRAFESEPVVVSVTPQAVAPGTRLNSAMGDTIQATLMQGNSDGLVQAIVVDPTQVTGDDYQVVFQDVAEVNSYGETTLAPEWGLVNVGTGDTLLAHQRNQSGDEDYPIIDGLQIRVVAPVLDVHRIAITHNGSGAIHQTAGFDVTAPPTDYSGYSADWYRDVLLSESGGSTALPRMQAGGGFFFVVAQNGQNTATSHEIALGRWLRGNSKHMASGRAFEIRFTAARSFASMAFSTSSLVAAPFELWDLGPDWREADDDVRLIPWLLDVDFLLGGEPGDGSDVFNFQLDHAASDGNDDPYSDWIYFRQPSDTSAGDSGYRAFVAAAKAGTYDFNSPELLGRVVLMNWDSHQGDGSENAFPEVGTVFRIEMTRRNRPGVVFALSTREFAPTVSLQKAREDVQRINVFPNPYYGMFRFENRFSGRYMTFNHLPEKATIRIFTLAGNLVRTLVKQEPGQFLRWNLANESDWIVGGGLYIAHIEMPDLGTTKILKLAVFPRQ